MLAMASICVAKLPYLSSRQSSGIESLGEDSFIYIFGCIFNIVLYFLIYLLQLCVVCKVVILQALAFAFLAMLVGLFNQLFISCGLLRMSGGCVLGTLMMLCILGLRCQLEGFGEGGVPNGSFYKVVDVGVFFGSLFFKFKEEETTYCIG